MVRSVLPTVVITETLEATCGQWLADHAQVVWLKQEATDNLQAYLPDVQGLVVRTYTKVDQGLIQQAPNLKVVGRAGVGLDNIDLQACRIRGVQVVYTPNANTQAVVEYVLCLILDDLRPRPSMDGYTPPPLFHELRRNHVGVQAGDLTLGILGFGRIGQRLGAIAHALGMTLLVNDLLPPATLRQAINYPCQFVKKDQLYSHSDILSVHIDARAENLHLINAQVLAQVKPSCLLINTSRGSVVDAEALSHWAGTVVDTGGRAVLDVHDPEPPPDTYPLYGRPNVRLLPHLASRTQQAMENMSWVVRDVVAVLEGRPPEYPAF